jgi:hypothetical protein
MANIVINIDGIEGATRLLSRSFTPIMQTITLAVGELVRDEIATYPGPVILPIEWSSAKQRAYYFAMRREEGLGPGYTRISDPMSQRLKESWTTDQVGAHDALLTSRATYAYWVQSKDGQQPFHRNTGWITDEAAVQNVEASGDIDRVASDAIARWLGD